MHLHILSMAFLINKIPNLTENVKVLILSKLEEGWSIRRLVQHYNIVKGTVQRVKQRWQEHGHFARTAGAERPKVSTAEQDLTLLNRLERKSF
jgi:transposase